MILWRARLPDATPEEHTLRQEFPNWWVRRGESGRWLAIRDDQFVYADSSEELRVKLAAELGAAS